ncbi:hypothetical protein, partial [Enterobacter intestinihominis]
IYHAGAAVLFLVMSLAGGGGPQLHIQQKNKPQIMKNNRLCIISTKLLIMGVANPKKNRYN